MQVCISAWCELTTTRAIGMSSGPIPWTAIIAWCEFHELDRENTMLLTNVIRHVDNERAERAAAKEQLASLKGGR